MLVREIYNYLDTLSPFVTQASWDNSGLLIGSSDTTVERIYLSLDIDTDLVQTLEPNSLVISHHPLIFSGLKKLDFERYPSNLIHDMMAKQCSLIAMHTNFDLSHLNAYVAKNVLGCKSIECTDFVCYFDVNQSFDDFTSHVKKSFGLENIRCVCANPFVKRCALTTGSGGDLIGKIEADCFLSGDFKYHQALEAKENKLSLIDIGHFESERYFSACLSEHLKKMSLKVIMSNSKNPFEYK
ncbi:MAG: Nif3-like dinuclear metal center hexameric protein [Sulfurospirillaceae bacterium]|jgi:dinuclear metal center YbgI/SA1388 family protein|nr:Nif3-like dinuclear metal center hexameric protein [Sulfurospirillaceae bacterium]MDD2827651.1 Nif3-like dinuclear metal center hexameric protein [Sulfurospirillaceae bacterium]